LVVSLNKSNARIKSKKKSSQLGKTPESFLENSKNHTSFLKSSLLTPLKTESKISKK